MNIKAFSTAYDLKRFSFGGRSCSQYFSSETSKQKSGSMLIWSLLYLNCHISHNCVSKRLLPKGKIGSYSIPYLHLLSAEITAMHHHAWLISCYIKEKRNTLGFHPITKSGVLLLCSSHLPSYHSG